MLNETTFSYPQTPLKKIWKLQSAHETLSNFLCQLALVLVILGGCVCVCDGFACVGVGVAM